MSGKQFAVIVSISFIVGMIWLIADIIFNTKPSIPVNPKLETLLQGVNPNFNSRVLEIIDKEVLDANMIQSLKSNPIIQPSTKPIQTATQSANPNI